MPGAQDDDEGRPAVDVRTDVVVDAANVVGSRPDGWWRDRAGAARRLLAQLSRLAAQRPGEVHAVLEGAARRASAEGLHDGVHVHLAPADGDSAVVALAERLVASGRDVLVVTADRGLRARLPGAARATGPGWLRDLLDALEQAGPEGPGE
ncbi:hypothetical protein FHN55_11785 [Streptomyces sp. NP160]|uniref:hypothetical protein n=1 Tax=Streptomyces sp. NP160 TaxID=2586637 RepID=UPI00111AC1E9|nr:hypothetical protein [Streptomyces sp. NP160]TNM67175.1 hypothetical protein FHN55_11785 [Streptomyces sp. NP160]